MIVLYPESNDARVTIHPNHEREPEQFVLLTFLDIFWVIVLHFYNEFNLTFFLCKDEKLYCNNTQNKP